MVTCESVETQNLLPASEPFSSETSSTAKATAPRGNTRWQAALVCLLISCGFSALLGIHVGAGTKGFLDFKSVYFGTRCLMQGCNPYKVDQLSAMYRAGGGEYPGEIDSSVQIVVYYVNLPTSFVVGAPFAVLPFGLALGMWLSFAAGTLVLAAWLIFRSAAGYAFPVSLCLIAFLLANCQIGFLAANTALIVVGLCVVAAWCFAEGKYGWAGVVCLAVCLAVKPHDAGWVWLYFLLSGGIYRRRALQTLALTSAFVLVALAWVWHVAPHWVSDWRMNLATTAAPGAVNEPGPHSVTGGGPGMIIDLQSAVSVLWSKPSIYNLVSYCICGALLLVWAFYTLKSRNSQEKIWLGLAAVAAPTLLITYHRSYDAKLLLLTIPACAMLWSKRGRTGWLALLITSAAIVSTSDFPLAVFTRLRSHIQMSTGGAMGKAVSMVILQPTPLILLVMGVFYLWVFCRYSSVFDTQAEPGKEDQRPLLLARSDSSPVAAVGTRG